MQALRQKIKNGRVDHSFNPASLIRVVATMSPMKVLDKDSQVTPHQVEVVVVVTGEKL